MFANHRHPSLNNWAIASVPPLQDLRQPLSVTEEVHHSTVIMVNSDLSLRRLLGEHLAQLNYAVLTAEGCEETLHLLNSKIVPLVLLNIRRPVKFGFDICRAIRQRSEVPILVFSDLEYLDDAAHALIVGADGYITAPFTLATLKIRLRGLLNTGF